ncbi:hypothetical protein [Actinomycetospora flava]|uniref:Thaumatin family protein n=1 Tax=Actinomycetospora flava TaxID=3129232 RepID=A0ABU8M836_9PSEU
MALTVALLTFGVVGVWWFSASSTTSPTPVASSEATSAQPAASGPQIGPAVVDTDGRPLPPPAADGARGLYSALETNDMTAVRALYAPDDTAASWSTLRARLAPDVARAGLLEALRRPPQPRPEVDFLYSAGDYGVGLTDSGRVAFIGTGQQAATTTATPDRARPTGSRSVPFECEDSFVGDGLDTPECDGSGTGTQRTQCSADLETCPAGYQEGVVNSANPHGCNFDAISADNPCQWRYTVDPDGTDRPAPVTAAQRWAACHLSGYRDFC